MSNKLPMPVIIIACICVVVLLIVMGRQFLTPPPAMHTAPPPWIDAATGKPKGQMSGSGQTNPTNGAPPGMSGTPGSTGH